MQKYWRWKRKVKVEEIYWKWKWKAGWFLCWPQPQAEPGVTEGHGLYILYIYSFSSVEGSSWHFSLALEVYCIIIYIVSLLLKDPHGTFLLLLKYSILYIYSFSSVEGSSWFFSLAPEVRTSILWAISLSWQLQGELAAPASPGNLLYTPLTTPPHYGTVYISHAAASP